MPAIRVHTGGNTWQDVAIVGPSGPQGTTGPPGVDGGLQLINIVTTFTYASLGDTNGLVYWLGTRAGAFATPVPMIDGLELHGANMSLRATSMFSAGYEPWKALDRATTNGFATASAIGEWLEFDFRHRWMRPNMITIRSRSDFANYPKNFNVEGSNDGITWVNLLTVTTALHTAINQWKSWVIGTLPGSDWHRLRIRSTGAMSDGATYLAFGDVEFYGVLSDPGGFVIYDEGVALPLRAKLDFKGTGVTVTDDAANAKTVVTATGGGSSLVVHDEGVALPVRSTLDFKGAGIAATDDAANAKTVITAAGGGSAITVTTHQNRPSAATAGVGAQAFVTDLADAKKLQISDGTRWLAVSDGLEVTNYVPGIPLVFQSHGDTNGIIYHLGATVPGTAFANPVPATSGVMVLNGTYLSLKASNHESGYPLFYATDRGNSYAFISGNVANSWLQLDFKSRMMAPDRVAIRHRSDGAGNGLVNFLVEGSDNEISWTTLATITGAAAPAAGEWRSWTIAGASSYRFLRIKGNGLDSSGGNYVTIGEIEFYGNVFVLPPVDLAYAADGDDKGVVAYLGKLTGGGVFTTPIAVTAAVVEIGAQMAMRTSSVNSATFGLAQAVDRTNTYGWAGTGLANEWIEIDLLGRKLAPNKLLLRARADDSRYAPVTVKLEGSNDRTAWTLLRGAIATGFTTGSAGVWKSFDIPGITEKYRYLRITSTGLSASGDNNTQLGEIEFYGTLYGG